MTNTCDCSRPCQNAFSCTECAKTARENLRHIADLTAALDEKRAKVRSNWDVSNLGASKPARKWRTDDNQTLTHAASPTFRPSSALVFDPRVSRVANRVHSGLVGIVREATGDPLLRKAWPTIANQAPTHHIAKWLGNRVNDLRLMPTAGETFDLIARMVGDLHRLFDNPPPALFLGECKVIGEDGNECTESLYLDREKITGETVACPRCGIHHDITERRKTLMGGVDDYLGTVKEISRLLRNLAGSDVSERMIHGYAAHGMLTRMGTRREFDKMGRPRDVALYRIGQVREAVRVVQSKRDKRRTVRSDGQGTEQRVG